MNIVNALNLGEAQMTGNIKIKISGNTKAELEKQLKDVLKEIEKMPANPKKTKPDFGSPTAWKITYDTK
ncbi:MAG: hypothetical protein JNL04_20895 [Rhodospirillaceae bacterium]|nr:hypothetical protein [Rhodospirillaceae bacterium]